MPTLPRATRTLLILNVLVFLLQQATGDALLVDFALWPLGPSRYTDVPGFEPWQLFTYSFLHDGFPHIAFNMLGLWMFGGQVEYGLGTRRYVSLYFACVLGAAVTQLATIALLQPGAFYPTLGASGGIYGLLIAFAMLYPRARIVPLYFPVPIPAPIAVVLFMVAELFYGVTGSEAGVAHFAHLGGAVVGFLVMLLWRGQGPRRFE
ncbi:MAG TPA: rhomboid family intramembrane serine protease [Rudaea sp.]|nr:rhomboid family intramembrane serine protease [Rudaea sp.]